MPLPGGAYEETPGVAQQPVPHGTGVKSHATSSRVVMVIRRAIRSGWWTGLTPERRAHALGVRVDPSAARITCPDAGIAHSSPGQPARGFPCASPAGQGRVAPK